jgi:hypothetical protein
VPLISPVFCRYCGGSSSLVAPDICSHSKLPGERLLIKLDIIDGVVNKTGISKAKAEMAVESVLESMKRAFVILDDATSEL